VIKNKSTDPPGDNDVYVGRPSPWGNPFKIGKHGTRDDVLALYALWLKGNAPEARWVRENIHLLRGKDLVCWCVPADCHAEILLLLANEEDT
jgi:hypothetical protein